MSKVWTKGLVRGAEVCGSVLGKMRLGTGGGARGRVMVVLVIRVIRVMRVLFAPGSSFVFLFFLRLLFLRGVKIK